MAPKHHFNVHSMWAHPEGDRSSRLATNNIDGNGIPLIEVVHDALDRIRRTGQFEDPASTKRLRIREVHRGVTDGIEWTDAWVWSGSYGRPAHVHNQDGRLAARLNRSQTIERPTLLRFEEDRGRHQLLFASGRHGNHGVFTAFRDKLVHEVNQGLHPSHCVIESFTDPDVLLALIENGTASSFDITLKNRRNDIADEFTATDEREAVRITQHWAVEAARGTGWIDRRRLQRLLTDANERRELATLVTGIDDDDELQSGEIRIPLRIGDRQRTVVLPILDTKIGGRLGFDVSGAPQTDGDGHPLYEWLAEEARQILNDLR